MSTTEGMEEKRGISRRDLIKKGAVAGAIVWTVPLIESVPAYAATGSSVFVCSWAIFVYYNSSTSKYYVNAFSGGGGPATPCGLGNNNKFSGTYTTPITDVSVTYNVKDVTISTTTGPSPIVIPLGGGSAAFGQTVDTSCPGGISYLGNATFKVDPGYEIINYCAFQGVPPVDMSASVTQVTLPCA